MIEWNYRIIKDDFEGDTVYYIAEVFYEGKKPVGWSEPISEFYESRFELRRNLKMMLTDTNAPTLEVGKDLEEGEGGK